MHVKPTKQQLQEGMKASLAALEAIPPETPPAADPPVVTPPADPPTTPAAPVVPEATPVVPAAPDPQIIPPVNPSVVPAAPAVDFEAKFKASTAEAQVLGFKQKEVDKAYADADALPEPKDEEVAALYPTQWEDMDETQRKLAKDNLHLKKKLDIINSAKAKFTKLDEWTGKITSFISDPQTLVVHPELDGKTEEFKHFASKPTRRDMDFDDLVLAFTGEQTKVVKAVKREPMFPTGSGGPAKPPAPVDNRLTLAQGEELRKSDYKTFKKMLAEGKIRTE